MNVVLADCEEFRRFKRKKPTEAAQEEKRTLGLVILRGEQLISVSVEAPPPTDNVGRKTALPSGPGISLPMGRGIPAPGSFAPPPGTKN